MIYYLPPSNVNNYFLSLEHMRTLPPYVTAVYSSLNG